MTQVMFGDTEHLMSRVSFENVVFSGDKNDIYEKIQSPKILSSPKPKTFQHYLEQTNGISSKDDLDHWNGNTQIRGHKMYWHRDNSDWTEGTVKNTT
jgi:hypothetical protein